MKNNSLIRDLEIRRSHARLLDEQKETKQSFSLLAFSLFGWGVGYLCGHIVAMVQHRGSL